MSISIIIAGLITGMLLGIFGSGGSIITAIQHWWHGNVNLRITAIFGLFGTGQRQLSGV